MKTEDVTNMGAVKAEHGVRPQHQSCHTATVDGYVIEGHVPAADIKRLIAEHPDIKGLTVPGMPVGSPGMEGGLPESYDVLTFDESGAETTYASY